METPRPADGLTPAKHDEERQRDVLNGFAYLRSFAELAEWSSDTVDALQKSNTPLLPRNAARNGSTKAILIHDYAGGYNEYEACQGAVVAKEQYSCQHLQYIEAFVYFSHRLVTIPPPTWINTCHRHGVKVLGTFIVEPGSVEVERILDQGQGLFWVARKLAQIAKAHCFDGWLINIETEFPLLSWSSRKLEGFLRQLRQELGSEGKVVWYDALTTVNFVWYQNTLNYLNLPFALAAGSILTNYAWTPELAKSARDCAIHNDLGLENVYFGIDVWAQNVQHGEHPRVTWPRVGGGGTGTGLGVQALKPFNLNAGIFAPGWSYEHFPEHSKAVERAVWHGDRLPQDLICDCGRGSLHSSVSYQRHNVTQFLETSPAGSTSFLHMDFRKAFTKTSAGGLVAHLGAQSVLPQGSDLEHRGDGGHDQGGTSIGLQIRDEPCRGVVFASNMEGRSTKQKISRLCFAHANITNDTPLRIRCKYRLITAGVNQCRVFLTVRDTASQSTENDSIELDSRGLAIVEKTIREHCMHAIGEIGLRVEWDGDTGLMHGSNDIVELHAITIEPEFAAEVKGEVVNPRIEWRGAANTSHHRLIWAIDTPNVPGSGLPRSEITGPFSYFLIFLDGREAGRAYALEFVLPEAIAERWKPNAMLEVKIEGIGFNGLTIAKSTAVLTWSGGSGEEWVVL